jgi:hypothetical protein
VGDFTPEPAVFSLPRPNETSNPASQRFGNVNPVSATAATSITSKESGRLATLKRLLGGKFRLLGCMFSIH